MNLKSNLKTRSTPKTQTDLLASCLHFLKFRPRSRYEIEVFLSRKTKKPDLISQTIAYLEELKLINDQDFASWFIRGRLKASKGPSLITNELKNKFNIPPAIIEHTLSSLDSSEVHLAASRYIKKVHYKLAKYPPFQAKQRAYRLLYQRGFPSSVIRSVIDESALGE